MSTPVVTLFGAKGGLGRTTLVYHLSWMFAELGVSTLAVDLDPQMGLTEAMLGPERLAKLVDDRSHGRASPLLQAFSAPDVVDAAATAIDVAPRLRLLASDYDLAAVEEQCARQWMDDRAHPPGTTFALGSLWRVVQRHAAEHAAQVILMDLAPSLSALNRIAIVSTDYLVMGLGLDMMSLLSLSHTGPTLMRWIAEWQLRRGTALNAQAQVPRGAPEMLGYVVLRYQLYAGGSLPSRKHVLEQLPSVFRQALIPEATGPVPAVEGDPFCLGVVREHVSLSDIGREAGKPIFKLRPADGATGSHRAAVAQAHEQFERLARRVLMKTRIDIP